MRRIALALSVSLVLGAVAWLATRPPRRTDASPEHAAIERQLEEPRDEPVLPAPADDQSTREEVPSADPDSGTTLVKLSAKAAAPAERSSTTLLFRLLDPDGRPIRHSPAQLEIASGPGDTSGAFYSLLTDGDGRARAGPVLRGTDARSLTFHAQPNGRGLEGRAELSAGAVREGADNDLGDVALSELRQLVAGRVVDARGEPVADGWVSVEALTPSGWSVTSLACVLERDGSFLLYGDPPEDELRLVARCDPRPPSRPIPFSRGTDGLLVTVGDSPTIEGSVRIPAWLKAEDLWIRVVRRRARDGGSCSKSDRPLSDGRFSFAGLTSGTFDLEVAHRPSDEILARVEGLELAPGQVLRDPRLQVLDLSASAHGVNVSVHLADGGKAAGTVSVRSAEGKRRTSTDLLVPGQVQLLRLRDPLDLVVLIDGYRPVHLTDVVADVELVLTERAIPVRLSLPAHVPQPPNGLRVELLPLPEDAGGPAFRTLSRTSRRTYLFDAAGEVELEVQLPGTYSLGFHVAGAIGYAAVIPGTSTLAITHERSFVVEPDPLRYAEALAAQRQR